MTDTTDRELLERAARAAGWKGWRSKHGYWNLSSPDGQPHTCCVGWPTFDSSTGEKLPEPTFADALTEGGWTPLVDDGDALRLAIVRNIEIGWEDGGAVVFADNCSEPAEENPAAATRRAIVRAAAALAEESKP
jgi:hypothetical protein